MKPKRTPRPALPPPGLRPKLRRDQLRDLALCHIQALDSIARGDAQSSTLWQVAEAALAWSRAAYLMHIGEAEMQAQLELALSLIERYKRTGRVLFTGSEAIIIPLERFTMSHVIKKILLAGVIAVLAVAAGRVRAPGAVGQPFVKEGK